MFLLAVPTRRGLLVLLLAAASTAVAFMNSGLIPAFTAASLDAIILSSLIMVAFSCTGMTLARKIPDGACGEMLNVELTLRNRLPLYRQCCTVHEKYPFVLSETYSFAVPALRPRETVTLTYPVKAEKRGSFLLEKVWLTTGDPLGLFYKSKSFRLPVHVEVYPRCFALNSLNAADERGGIPDAEGRNLGHAGKGLEFFGVRPYRIGDEVRHIHWKSTAGKNKLMVKEFEAAAIDQITILLDTDKRMKSPEPGSNNFEFLISCADSISAFLSQKYCHLRFFAADGSGDLCQLSGDAASVRQKIRQTLTLLQESDMSFQTVLSEAVENIPRRSEVYLLSMTENIAEYAEILAEQDCFCSLIYAPARNFPPIEADKPRIVKKTPVPAAWAELPGLASIADFTSGAEILEQR